jgi:hypothetical protein
MRGLFLFGVKGVMSAGVLRGETHILSALVWRGSGWGQCKAMKGGARGEWR